MKRAARDSFVATTDQKDLAYGPSACLETPPELYAKLNAEFHFDVDLTANEVNALHPCHFGPNGVYTDALTAPWWYPSSHSPRRTGYSNPPYGAFILALLAKAIEERIAGFTSVFLLPMRASGWYRNLVLPYADEVRHCDDRVKFWYQGTPKLTLNSKTGKWEHMGALFDSIVVVYRPSPRKRHPSFGGCPHFSVWSWK